MPFRHRAIPVFWFIYKDEGIQSWISHTYPLTNPNLIPKKKWREVRKAQGQQSHSAASGEG